MIDTATEITHNVFVMRETKGETKMQRHLSLFETCNRVIEYMRSERKVVSLEGEYDGGTFKAERREGKIHFWLTGESQYNLAAHSCVDDE